MNRKFCDRCEKEININPMVQIQNPLFDIRQIIPKGCRPIDLCEACSNDFLDWVRGKNSGENNA